MVSSGTRNLLGLIGGWCIAGIAGVATVVYFDEIRTTLGIKFDAKDFGIVAEAPQAKPEPEVRTIIKYVERPAEEAKGVAKDAHRETQGRYSYTPNVVLHRERDGHFHAEAYINGRPVQTLVDTGATRVALTYEDAQAAGINVGESDFIYWSNTANGRARFASVTLSDVRIGDVVVRNVPAAVSEPGRLNKTLLGMSFLGQTRMQMQGTRLVLEQ